METVGTENDSAVSNISAECAPTLEDSKPSDCKIPKTESEDSVGNVADSAECVTSNSNESVEVKVVYNKNKYDVNVDSTSTIADFKKQLHTLLGVPDSMQKLMYKGLLQDSQTIIEAGITKGSKIMLVGSTLNDVLAVSSITKQDIAESEKASSTTKEPLSKQKLHRKVLDKGIPEDAMPALKNVHESLPSVPLSGMLNKHGGKVRLTFKLETDQLWLSTKERTEKLPMSSIKNVVSEPIEEHDQYHVLGLQLGPTEASRYWIYWVPAQYVKAIKYTILGQWQSL